MTVSNCEHLLKAEIPISLNLLDRKTFSNCTQLSKAEFPIYTTLSGSLISFNSLQPLKDCLPMEYKFLGNLTNDRFEHNAYLQPIITQYFASNKSEIWP